MNNYNYKDFKHRTLIYILVSIIVLTVFSVIGWFLRLDLMAEKYLSDFNIFDLLLGQISNTLIVLSLTSVLSENFGQVYWKDIKIDKLINPPWLSFTGMTIYLLTGLVVSILSYAMSFYVGTLTSFAVSTLLLVVLTFKMISIYFGKENLKRQLALEYKKMLVLTNASYVSDYLKRLEMFEKDCEKDSFPNKRKFVSMLKMEINEINSLLNSRDESDVDKAHKEHVNKYIRKHEELKVIDEKIEEYTRNAINKNDNDVIRENVELLVECENYYTFLNLIEELFDWDEKYACRMLKNIDDKRMAWVYKDNLNYFKQYAFHKLISSSGKLDALQNLLFIYDPSNLGMSKVKEQIGRITKQALKCQEKEHTISEEILKHDDINQGIRAQSQQRKELKEQYRKLKMELMDILSKLSAKDIRSYYVPIKETYIAYMEGRYEEVNKLATAIVLNFRQDLQSIQMNSGIMQVQDEISFEFSYVTDEELFYINQIIEKDSVISVISKSAKETLASMNKVHIDNNPWSYINDETLDAYHRIMDLPRKEES